MSRRRTFVIPRAAVAGRRSVHVARVQNAGRPSPPPRRNARWCSSVRRKTNRIVLSDCAIDKKLGFRPTRVRFVHRVNKIDVINPAGLRAGRPLSPSCVRTHTTRSSCSHIASTRPPPPPRRLLHTVSCCNVEKCAHPRRRPLAAHVRPYHGGGGTSADGRNLDVIY